MRNKTYVKTVKVSKKKYLYNYFQIGYYFHENCFTESFYWMILLNISFECVCKILSARCILQTHSGKSMQEVNIQ